MKRSIAFAAAFIRALARPQAHYAALLCALLAVPPAFAGSGNVSGSPTATQAEAEAGTNNTKKLTPLRAAQQTTARIATQGEAEAGTDNVKVLTPLRAAQQTTARIATQGEAEAGTDNVKAMTPLRVQNAFDKPEIFPAGMTIGSNYCSSATMLLTAGTAIPDDDTIPQNTEGDEIITCAYTAKISGSELRFNFSASYTHSAGGAVCALFVDTTANALKAWAFANDSTNTQHGSHGLAKITAADTNAHTYKIRCGKMAAGAAITFNGEAGARNYGGTTETVLLVQEIR